MSKEKYISQEFPIRCSGRNTRGEEVLEKPIKVIIDVHQSPGDERCITITPKNCPFLAGGHGERCNASSEKGKTKAVCVYSADIPYALEGFNKPGNRGKK